MGYFLILLFEETRLCQTDRIAEIFKSPTPTNLFIATVNH